MAICKTHEEFMAEASVKNTKVDVLGQYVHILTRIKVRCKTCSYEWMVLPGNLLRNGGCLKCQRTKHKKTNDRFIEELKTVHSTIVPLDDFVSSSSKIRFKCTIDDTIWHTTPAHVLSGTGCPHCCGRIKLTTEEFSDRLKVVTGTIEVLGEFVSVTKRIKVRCKLDGHVWNPPAYTLLSGVGCAKCSNLKKTHEQFVEDLKAVTDTIIPLEPYVRALQKIRFKCTKCEHEWSATPDNIQRGRGCPACKKTGFQPEKSAFFYVYKFLNYVGFGITNNFKKRNHQHQKTFSDNGISAKVLLLVEGYGQTVRDFESSVIAAVGGVNTGIKGFINEGALEEDYATIVSMVKDAGFIIKYIESFEKNS